MNNGTSKLNLLNETNDSKFMMRSCNIVNDQLKANYAGGNEITYSTELWKSNLCDYNNDCILVRGNITMIGHKNGVRKIDGKTIDDAGVLELVRPIYNLLEYSLNILIQWVVYGFIIKIKQLIWYRYCKYWRF